MEDRPSASRISTFQPPSRQSAAAIMAPSNLGWVPGGIMLHWCTPRYHVLAILGRAWSWLRSWTIKPWGNTLFKAAQPRPVESALICSRCGFRQRGIHIECLSMDQKLLLPFSLVYVCSFVRSFCLYIDLFPPVKLFLSELLLLWFIQTLTVYLSLILVLLFITIYLFFSILNDDSLNLVS